MKTKYLITGGSGRLGRELKKHLNGYYPSHKKFDITKFKRTPECDVIIHLASYTNVDKAESEPDQCFDVNVLGTHKLAKLNKPIVFISSEHANAEGVYFQSKLIGEMIIKNLVKSYLIIRTLFKPKPWPFDYAFSDQMTQGDYVDVIAKLIAEEVKSWDGKSKSIFVGTGRKSMYDLAKTTKPDVKPNSINDLPLKRPKDYI